MGKIAIVYWSGTGNTESMAYSVADGVKKAGGTAEIFTVSEFNSNSIAEYDKIALGCPSMGSEVLEEYEFEPFFTEIESKLSGKNVALFGSYGWGDGQWMRDWQDRVEGAGAKLISDGLIINETPDDAGKELCIELGVQLSSI